MIYTPCLGLKSSDHVKMSKDVCGEHDAWEASWFPGKLPMGTVSWSVGTPMISPFDGGFK
jgi:hypothetical protein